MGASPTSTRVASRGRDTRTEPSFARWVGIPELADYLGVGRNTIRRHVEQGRIPFIRVGHQYRFNVAEVVAAYGADTHSVGR